MYVFALFVVSVAPVFVSYTVTDYPNIRVVSSKRLTKKIAGIERGVVFPDIRGSKSRMFYFENVSILFPTITFLSVPFSSHSGMDYRRAMVVSDGELAFSYEIKEEETDALVFFHNWVEGYELVENMAELKIAIEQCPFTILAHEPTVAEAIELGRKHIKDIGFYQVLAAPHDVFKMLEHETTRFLYYRRDDKVLVDSSTTDIVNASIPYYKEINLIDIKKWNSYVMVVLISSNHTREDDDLFLRLAQKYPEFRFGSATRDAIRYASSVMKREISDDDRFYFAFHDGLKYHYEPSMECTEYVEKIKQGRLEKLYMSDDVPEEFDGTLVGETYEEKIEQRTQDVLVFYHFGTSNSMITTLRQILSTVDVDFWTIDVRSNSSPLVFPKKGANEAYFAFFPQGAKAQMVTKTDEDESVMGILNFVGAHSRQEKSFDLDEIKEILLECVAVTEELLNDDEFLAVDFQSLCEYDQAKNNSVDEDDMEYDEEEWSDSDFYGNDDSLDSDSEDDDTSEDEYEDAV